MKRIAATKLKERCLELLDELDPEGVVITRRGKPVARLIPWTRPSTSLLGALKGRIQIRGELLSTGDPADEIIAATSLVHGVPLITRDRRIRTSAKVPLV